MEFRLSPNFDQRPVALSVDMLVLHYTGMKSAGQALERLCDTATKVSAHYLINENGRVYSMVTEDRRAWHAGIAWWRGHSDINARSIGIELVNPGHEFGLAAYSEAQMLALIGLAGDILARYSIPPVNVVGHSDIAPGRKQDPGELFDWPRLASAGIGLWPGPAQVMEPDDDRALNMLQEIGYDVTDRLKTVEAFQRRYRPARVDGVIDGQTAGLIACVLAISS